MTESPLQVKCDKSLNIRKASSPKWHMSQLLESIAGMGAAQPKICEAVM